MQRFTQPMTAIVSPTPSAVAIGAISKLIGVRVIGINAVSDDGNIAVTVTSMFRTPQVGRLLGGTPMKSAGSLQGHD